MLIIVDYYYFCFFRWLVKFDIVVIGEESNLWCNLDFRRDRCKRNWEMVEIVFFLGKWWF